MKRPVAYALSAMLVASVATFAQAGMISQTQPFGPDTPNFVQTLTFNQYNGNLVDLQSVEITLDLAISGGFLIVDNDGAEPAAVTVKLGASGSLSSLDVTLLDIGFQPVVSDVDVFTSNNFALGSENGDGAGNVDSSGPDGATHFGSAASNSGSGFINPAFFAGFVGAGTFDIDAEIDQILDFGGIGGVEGSFGPVSAEGTVTVKYTYVPEPTTVAFLGLGSLMFIRRRR